MSSNRRSHFSSRPSPARFRTRSGLSVPSVRSQELLYESLLNWLPDALFLPGSRICGGRKYPARSGNRGGAARAAHAGRARARAARDRRDARQPRSTGAATRRAARRRRCACGAARAKRWRTLVESLGEAGYERVAQVTTRGQFAVRGGILDLFSWQAPLPVRAEFFGDEIESLREFDVDTQTSVRNLQSMSSVLLGAADDQSGQVRDYIAARPSSRRDRAGRETSDAEIRISEGWIEEGEPEDFSGAFRRLRGRRVRRGRFHARGSEARAILRAPEGMARERVRASSIYFQTEGEIERFREIMGEPVRWAESSWSEGTLARGFCFPAATRRSFRRGNVRARSDAWAAPLAARANDSARNRAQIDFSELNEGDLVVHLEHGVGRFAGDCKSAGGGRRRCRKCSCSNSPTTRDSTFRSSRPTWFRVTSASGKNPAAQFAGRREMGAREEKRGGLDLRLRGQNAGRPGRARNAARPRLWRRHQMADANSSIRFPFRETPDQLKAIADDQARHGTSRARWIG